jgi:hypothetical protein
VFCLFLALIVLSAAGFRGTATVGATTGGAIGPALYKVPYKIAVLYPGEYVLQSAASGAHITTYSGGIRSHMLIDFNSLQYLAGVAQFSGYDAHGFQSTWLATMYNFHLTAKDTMVMDLLGPANATLFGRMYLRRTKTGDLVGHIALPIKQYAIAWHKTLSL